MRRLSRRQLAALVIVGIWALLLAVDLFGGSIAGLPRMLTVAAGTVAVVAVFWFMPAGYLAVLVIERRQGAVRAQGLGALADRGRSCFAFVSALTLFVGLVWLLPSADASVELRLGGAVILVFGLIGLTATVLAFRTKVWMSDANRVH